MALCTTVFRYLFWLAAGGILLFHTSCSPVIKQQNAASDEQAIRRAMQRQEIAWNKGDLEAFMQAYWKSDQLRFIGSKGLRYGWGNTLEAYKKGYPDRAAMGRLHFEVEMLERVGKDAYFMVGKYELQRIHDHPSGYFTLLWKRIGGQWKIVSDMTCG